MHVPLFWAPQKYPLISAGIFMKTTFQGTNQGTFNPKTSILLLSKALYFDFISSDKKQMSIMSNQAGNAV